MGIEKHREQLAKMSDRNLVQESLNGHNMAFETLVYRYRRRLYGYIFKIIKEHSVTEELIQETFVKAYYALSQCNNADAFWTWIVSIAHNCCMAWFKKRKREKNLELPNSTDLSYDNQEGIHMSERLAALDEMVRQLSEENQKLLYLKYQEGKSCEQIANILNKPIGTVMSQLSRIYETIRNRMKFYHGGTL